MTQSSSLQGRLDAGGRRFAVVAARFNSRLVDLLLGGAVDCLERHGAAPADITVVRVPGAYELPLALDSLAKTGRYDALVALGVVVRGETPHFDYVCSECSKGITSVMHRHGLPVGFGVLTTDTSAQAEERCGGKVGNKGFEAALAAIEMADLLAVIGGDEK
ncbi:MAG: 6,7-dimethyl-8-ribityllumazine synthase [Acidobacteriota bacterium]